MNEFVGSNLSYEFLREADIALRVHGAVLPLLANGRNSDFVFFTHDLDRRIKFLSESSYRLLRIKHQTWIDKTLDDFLTSHPWNSVLQLPDRDLDPNAIQSLQFEILDDDGKPTKIQAWRRLVLLQNIPIGIVGIIKRLPATDDHDEIKFDIGSIRSRITTLTARESKVVELVVAGEMNKSIAEILGIAVRTVEARRSKAMKKMGAKRLSELVRMWIASKEAD